MVVALEREKRSVRYVRVLDFIDVRNALGELLFVPNAGGQETLCTGSYILDIRTGSDSTNRFKYCQECGSVRLEEVIDDDGERYTRYYFARAKCPTVYNCTAFVITSGKLCASCARKLGSIKLLESGSCPLTSKCSTCDNR